MGVISFVGAGPGAPDLLTLRGADRLARAAVVVWASSLVPEAVLDHTAPDAEIHDSAGMTLEDVVAVFAAHPDEPIVRLHSGDVSVYSAMQEQLDWCRRHDRAFEIVPGVGALAAASAAVARELTVPGTAQTVVATRLPGRTAASVPANEELAALAAHGTTMAVYLSGARPDELRHELLAGGAYRPDTPAAVVVRASWPDEQVVVTTVGELPAAMRSTGTRTVMLVLVGEALQGAADRCHLYDPTYAHGYRRRSRPGSTEGRPARAGGSAATEIRTARDGAADAGAVAGSGAGDTRTSEVRTARDAAADTGATGGGE
jgi:precorrin-4/cobalt-precorrin-4 C11-methyltransferase